MSSSFTTDLSLVNLFYFNNHNNHPVDLLVGEIIIWPTNSNYPKGFLLCDGSSYSTTEYSELYAVISNTYGSGTGTFQVPDFRNKHIRAGNMQGTIQFGDTGGNNTIKTDDIPLHKHNITYTESNWIYNATHDINYQISPVNLFRANTTTNSQTQQDIDVPGNESRALGSHFHNITYNNSNISNDRNNSGTITPLTNISSYINSVSLQTQYSTTNTGSPFSGGSSYVPKSKKVYYLIYSGKH